MEYKLIVKVTVEELEKEVNIKLSNGWELYGNPMSHQGAYAQAVIKKVKIAGRETCILKSN
ncbi:DUF1737 domain-containing protein [Vibrio sp. TBV020]|uniref:DUF1737 domain-containing protein n=1 Tax=Vibrio sp. TBV020 TaxID=3137398 RepID=UPI0038CD83E0